MTPPRRRWTAPMALLALALALGLAGAPAAQEPDAVPAEAKYLDALLLDDPGPAPGGVAFVLLPEYSGLVTAEQLRRLGVDERGIVAFRALTGTARAVSRHWATAEDATHLRLMVFDYAASARAEEQLEVTAKAPGWSRETDAGTLVRISQSREAGQREIALAATQGQFFLTAGARGTHAVEVLRPLAAGALERQREKLHAEGPASEEGGGGAAQFVGYVFGTLGLVAALRLLAGRWKRRRVRVRSRAGDGDGALVTVAARARRLRTTGRRLGIAVYLGAAVAVAALPFSWIVSVLALAALAGLVLQRRRAERLERWARVGLRRPRMLRSAAIAVLSVCLLAVAAMFALAAATTSVVGPTLEQADLERESGIDFSNFGFMVLVLPLLAIVLFRVARRQARLRADELRRLDDRRPVLYLRGFADDGLKIPGIVSGRRPLVELLSPFPSDEYESVVAWTLDSAGPTIAIAPPGSRLGSLGAAREHVGTEEWQQFVAGRMQESGVIALSLGRSEGVLWEWNQVLQRGLSDRMLMLFPPVGDDELRARWAALGDSAQAEFDPAAALVAVFADGRPTAFTADQRDEAGYRAAIATALERVATAAAPPEPAKPAVV